MTLPVDLQFSQASLQDYIDCQRRFQLRYLLRLAWPAVEAEPALENERHLQLGAEFHRLVQQHLLGLPVERLSIQAGSRDLGRWWGDYLEYAPSIPGLGAPSNRKAFPEVTLAASLNGYRLLAKYDAIVLAPDGPEKQAFILDWKTSRVRPKRAWLAARLQTRLYPYLLVRGGAHLNQATLFRPEQVEMIYWFANFPSQPERFAYSESEFLENQSYLAGLLEKISSLGEDEFLLTARLERCRFCTYRSLCDRGVHAGDLRALEDEGDFLLSTEEETGDIRPDLDLDFEHIAEIEF